MHSALVTLKSEPAQRLYLMALIEGIDSMLSCFYINIKPIASIKTIKYIYRCVVKS